MIKFGIIFSVIFWLINGCATTQKTSKTTDQVETKNKIVQVEDLDPFMFDDDEFVVKKKIQDEQSGRTNISNRSDPLVSTISDSAHVHTIQVQGFRVQIGSFANIEDANKIKREAMLIFENDNVYSIFESNFYKIRVGDFENRREAESLQEKAITRGFHDAWIVRTMVEKRVRE